MAHVRATLALTQQNPHLNHAGIPGADKSTHLRPPPSAPCPWRTDYAQSGGLRKGGGGWPTRSINPDVGDQEIARRLWEETERILGAD